MSSKELIMAWIIGGGLLLVSLWFCAMHAVVFWKIFVRKTNAPSWVPLIGGILGCFGLLTIPIELAHKLSWLPLVLDYGCLPGILHIIIAYVIQFSRKRD
jgi:hypothetical protein